MVAVEGGGLRATLALAVLLPTEDGKPTCCIARFARNFDLPNPCIVWDGLQSINQPLMTNLNLKFLFKKS